MAKDKGPLPSAAPADDKKRAIDTAMAQIERMYGKGSIMRFGDRSELNVDYIPTGSLALDVALGHRGPAQGRIIEIYGPESSGKTTLALHVVAEAQKRGARWPLSTPSTPWTPPMPELWGSRWRTCSSPSRTPASRPGDHRGLVRSGAIDVIVVDSVAALVPRAEIEGEMGDIMWACRPA